VTCNGSGIFELANFVFGLECAGELLPDPNRGEKEMYRRQVFKNRGALSWGPIALLGMAIQGCYTYGVIHVDRPEVFMRERLTAARARERQWLQAKLEKDPGVRFQGLKDVRTFMGFYNRFSGSYDPLAGRIADSILKREGSKAERLRETEAGSDPATLSETDPKLRRNQEGRVAAVAQGSTSRDADKVLGFNSPANFPNVPDPRAAKHSEADLTSVEEFNDKLAYRNAVAAALRQQELDDTHDLQGFTIYTLKFDISLMPPQNSSLYSGFLFWRKQNHNTFGKVELALVDPANRNEIDENFYRGWLASIQKALDSEVMNLQRRLVTTGFIEEDRIEILRYLNLIEETRQRKKRNEKEQLAKQEDFRNRFRKAVGAASIAELTRLEEETLRDISQRYVQSELEMSLFSKQDQQLSRRELKQLEGLTTIRFGGRSYNGEADLTLQSLARYALKMPELPTAVEQLKGAVSFVIAEKYHHLLKGLLTLDIVEINPLPSILKDDKEANQVQKRYVLKVKPLLQRDKDQPLVIANSLAGVLALRKAMGQIQLKMKDRLQQHYVYSVDPKQYAQNMSDVSSSEKLMNMLAYRQGLLPKGLGLEETSQYLRRSQTFLQSILRKPLVVGYIKGRHKFGWLLGPRFYIENDSIDFQHIPVQYSFNCSIVVPAWWSSCRMSGDYVWLKDSGQEVERTKLFSGPVDDSNVDPDSARSLEIRLPQDFSAVTTALIDHLGRGTRRPEIYANGHTFMRQGDRGVTMLIRGRDLWRNPKIFIGHQKADGYELTPDMKGVVAYFREVRAPANITDSGLKVDLTVVTSLGSSTLRNVVTILPSRVDEIFQDPTLAIRLRTRNLFRPHPKRNSTISLEVNSNLLPRGYQELLLYARPLGNPNWERLQVVGRRSIVNRDLSYVDFHFKRYFWDRIWRQDWGAQRSAVFELDLRVKLKPDEAPRPVMLRGRVQGKLVYLMSTEETRVRLDAGTVNVKKQKCARDLSITMNNRNVFMTYYPGLEQSMLERSVEIVFREQGGKKLVVAISLKNPGVALKKKDSQFPGDILTLDGNTLNDHSQLFPPAQGHHQRRYSISLRYKDKASKQLREIPALTQLTFNRVN
jgi:hypothetical protein